MAVFLDLQSRTTLGGGGGGRGEHLHTASDVDVWQISVWFFNLESAKGVHLA